MLRIRDMHASSYKELDSLIHSLLFCFYFSTTYCEEAAVSYRLEQKHIILSM